MGGSQGLGPRDDFPAVRLDENSGGLRLESPLWQLRHHSALYKTASRFDPVNAHDGTNLYVWGIDVPFITIAFH
jgi:hypothetical protein